MSLLGKITAKPWEHAGEMDGVHGEYIVTRSTGQMGLWLFLAVVMDLYSRRIVGWSMGRRMSRHLVIDALRMAIGRRQPAEGLVHHSDRSAQYTSDDFLAELKENGMKSSMSGSGCCYDNAVVDERLRLALERPFKGWECRV